MSDPRPRIDRLHIQNYRVLKDVEFKKLTPLTVLLGPNGSGKSTVFDVFAFLHEAFTVNLRSAWDRRNRIRELRSRDAVGPIRLELSYRERPGKGSRLVTYKLAIDEEAGAPIVVEETLRWNVSRGAGRPQDILRFSRGQGQVVDEETGTRSDEPLDSPDLLAVSTLGQFARHPRVAALRRFIAGWYLSYVTTNETRSLPESGPQATLSQSGDNLPNVIQYLSERHPERLSEIVDVLGRRIPQLKEVETSILDDGRLMLRLKDGPFSQPILSKYASDGTLKLLAYLTVLYSPEPPPIVGIEEPENFLHPRLLNALAEEARGAAERSQLLVTTHSPYFVDALKPQELWILDRAEDGYARVTRASSVFGLPQMVAAGGKLGSLWMEGYFDVGNPLTVGGMGLTGVPA